MPRTLETQVYKFSELSNEAKECARAWWREHALNYEWWDNVYDDAKECAKLIGIQIDKIYFSGFSSQGDGACFEGRYSYTKGAVAAIKAHAPQDTTLHAIAQDLQAIQKRVFYRASAIVKHTGHYYHEHSTTIRIDNDNDAYGDIPQDVEEGIKDALRAFMQWIYRQLEREYEYQLSNECVDETIEANEYEFTDSGNIV